MANVIVAHVLGSRQSWQWEKHTDAIYLRERSDSRASEPVGISRFGCYLDLVFWNSGSRPQRSLRGALCALLSQLLSIQRSLRLLSRAILALHRMKAQAIGPRLRLSTCSASLS